MHDPINDQFFFIMGIVNMKIKTTEYLIQDIISSLFKSLKFNS